MIALLAALTLTATSLTPLPTFEPTLFDTPTLQGAGGDAGAGPGAKLAFVALGTFATGGLMLVGLPVLSGINEAAGIGPGPLFFALPILASVAVHVGLGALLDVDVSWASAFVGAGFGVASAAALGFAFLMLVPDQSLISVLMFFFGAAIGYAVGTPLFTMLDPLGLATPRRAAAPAAAPEPAAPDVTIEVRPMGASAVERVGTSVALWAGSF